MAQINFNGMSYTVWENAVNVRMVDLHGVGIDDIPDMNWHVWFIDDVEVHEAVDMAIEKVNEGGF